MSLAGALRGTVCQRLVPRHDGRGRVPAVEVMVVNGRIQQAILDPLLTSEIEQIIVDGEYYGMQTFDQALAKYLQQGVIDLREAMNTASNPHDLKVMLERMGVLQAGRTATAAAAAQAAAASAAAAGLGPGSSFGSADAFRSDPGSQESREDTRRETGRNRACDPKGATS